MIADAGIVGQRHRRATTSGSDASGKLVLGNGTDGVVIQRRPPTTRSAAPPPRPQRHLGQRRHWRRIDRCRHHGNVVEGDYIGTDAGGHQALATPAYGVLIIAGAWLNTVGGTVAAARDVISGNGYAGQLSSFVRRRRAFERVRHDGQCGRGRLYRHRRHRRRRHSPTSGRCVDQTQGSSSNTIGGTAAGSGDVISGNSVTGAVVSDPGTTGIGIYGDFIGTNAAGNAILGSGSYGVSISNGASFNVIGGSTARRGRRDCGERRGRCRDHGSGHGRQLRRRG